MTKCVFFFFALGLAACGSKSSSNNAAAPAGAAPPTVAAEQVGTGSWKTACYAADKNSIAVSLELTDAGMTFTETMYFRDGCEPSLQIALYKYTYEKPVTDKPDLDGYETVKLAVKSATVTLTNPSLVGIFNRNDNYGRSDWELDKETDIAGRAHSKKYAPLPAVGDEIAYTYKASGESLQLADYKFEAKTKTYKAVTSALPKNNFTRVK